VSPLHFFPNHVSDAVFESYLKDTHRYLDYCDLRDHVIPELIDAIDALPQLVHFRFSCSNRFEGAHPRLRILCPVGFVPDVIDIEFPPRHEAFQVKQAAQALKVQGMGNLENHLRVILMMGLAHWQPK